MAFLLLAQPLTGVLSAEQQPKVAAAPSRVELRNVELTVSGHLNVQVIDASGHRQANVPVLVEYADQQMLLTSDAQGQLHPDLAKGGLVVMQIHDSVYACRVWRHRTAPPGALSSIALVDENEPVVRANRRNDQHQGHQIPREQRTNRLERKYGLAALALGGTAAYFALSRDNASD